MIAIYCGIYNMEVKCMETTAQSLEEEKWKAEINELMTWLVIPKLLKSRNRPPDLLSSEMAQTMSVEFVSLKINPLLRQPIFIS